MLPAEMGPLLVVEDSDEDWEALTWAARKVGGSLPRLERCADGESAMARLHRGPRPSLVLLDLNLGAIAGQEVLGEVRRTPELCMVPVVIWTTSANPDDVQGCYRAGANTYLHKPVGAETLIESVRALVDYWYRVAVLPATGERA